MYLEHVVDQLEPVRDHKGLLNRPHDGIPAEGARQVDRGNAKAKLRLGQLVAERLELGDDERIHIHRDEHCDAGWTNRVGSEGR